MHSQSSGSWDYRTHLSVIPEKSNLGSKGVLPFSLPFLWQFIDPPQHNGHDRYETFNSYPEKLLHTTVTHWLPPLRQTPYNRWWRYPCRGLHVSQHCFGYPTLCFSGQGRLCTRSTIVPALLLYQRCCGQNSVTSPHPAPTLMVNVIAFISDRSFVHATRMMMIR